MERFDPKALRRAFGSYMTGVTVVTARAADNTPVGFTANSFTSVSMDPPLLLVCPGNHLSSIEVFRSCKHFTVNILAEGQEDISNVFAGSRNDRFEQVDWRPDQNGVPVISRATACFSCSVHAQINAGDHLILIGKIEEFCTSDSPGLGYANGGYFSLGNERLANAAPHKNTETVVGAIVEHDDVIYVEKSNGQIDLPAVTLTEETPASSGIKDHLSDLGLSATMGSVYSVFDDKEAGKKFVFFRATLPWPPLNLGDRFLSIEGIEMADWRSQAVGKMMRRYVLERSNNVFGLYIGDAVTGEVHLGDGSGR